MKDTIKEASLSISDKVEELNEATEGTLSIAYYTEWELHSYAKGSLFYSLPFYIEAKSFEKLVEKAYRKMKEAEASKERAIEELVDEVSNLKS